MLGAAGSRHISSTLAIALVLATWACSSNGGETRATTSVASAWQTDGESPPTGTIAARVTGFRNDMGRARLALFAGEEGFPDEVDLALEGEVTPISDGAATVRFEDVPYGEYAIAVIHDEDANGELNTNLLGIPREGVGASNDARATFGPPDYEDAAFVLDAAELELVITIDYF